MSPFSQVPFDDVPDWIKATATFVFGAGSVRMLQVWLENRRIGRSEYREHLLGRIRELEEKLDGLLEEIGDLRVTAAELRSENEQLREELERRK